MPRSRPAVTSVRVCWSAVASGGRLALLVALRGTRQRGLGGGEPGDRDAERRAGHVVEPDRLALEDRLRGAAVLATDGPLDAGLRRAALVDCDLHQAGDRVVERLERVDRQDLVLDVLQQEAALGVVAAATEPQLVRGR